MMNFAAFDLNLLKVFDAMMLEMSTTRAAERLGLSQPAVSSALARLRRMTGDDLFVRDGKGMVPTALAIAMRDQVRQAMQQLEDAFAQAAGFDPATSVRVFSILGSDYFSTLLMPQLAAAAHAEAPGVVLRMVHASTSAIPEMLAEGQCDMALDRAADMPNWVESRTLLKSNLVCIAARGHDEIAAHGLKPGDALPMDLFCSLPQAIMSMDGTRTGSVEPTLRRGGVKRNVTLTLPHFHAVALAVAGSKLIGNMPVHFARHVATYLPIDLYRLPVPVPDVAVTLYWHRRHERDPANEWLRRHVMAAMDMDRRYPET